MPRDTKSVANTQQKMFSLSNTQEACAASDFLLDQQGWIKDAPEVEIAPSPHCDARPQAGLDDLHTVVLHNISLPPLTFGSRCVHELFLGSLNCQGNSQLASLEGVRVSSHFFIDRRGRLTQFVSVLQRAWHAGVSRFNGKTRCNDFSIGIEMEGTDFVPFEEPQYQTLVRLLRAIDARVGLQYIVGHSDIAPQRKTDPGPYFDWVRLMRCAHDFGSPRFVGAAACQQWSIRHPQRTLV